MSASSDSNDASDIFWPGYVDAVTNLAINLLFVIAVMSIVVISSILQIARMKPDSGAEMEKNKNPAKTKVEINIETKEQEKHLEQKKQDRINSQEDWKSAEITIKAQAEQIAKLELENKQLKNNNDSKRPNPIKKERPGGTDSENTKAEVISAADIKSSTQTGENQILPLTAGGILVVFDKDVIELSDKEAEKLITKISDNYPLITTNWQIRVNVPKGFSESARIGYYRVNAIRNTLLKHNVAPNLISMRVVESSSESANNARILIRAVQP